MDTLESRRANGIRYLVPLAVLAGAAGCASPMATGGGASKGLLAAPSRDVYVVFDSRGCPADIDPGPLDSQTNCNRPRCFKVPAKLNHRLTFHARPATRSDGQYNDFELQFDPFKGNPLKSSNGDTSSVTVDVDMPDKSPGGEKAFPYNVVAVRAPVQPTPPPPTPATCKVLDPEIIVVK